VSKLSYPGHAAIATPGRLRCTLSGRSSMRGVVCGHSMRIRLMSRSRAMLRNGRSRMSYKIQIRTKYGSISYRETYRARIAQKIAHADFRETHGTRRTKECPTILIRYLLAFLQMGHGNETPKKVSRLSHIGLHFGHVQYASICPICPKWKWGLCLTRVLRTLETSRKTAYTFLISRDQGASKRS